MKKYLNVAAKNPGDLAFLGLLSCYRADCAGALASLLAPAYWSYAYAADLGE